MTSQTESTTEESAPTRWSVWQPWLSLAVRLSMAGILIAAAIPKMLNIEESVYAVGAYQLVPEWAEGPIGVALPYFELALAVVLLAGMFTRPAAIVWLLMMAAFVFGVSWAWAKGLNIDCGCFGGGGELPEGETTNYYAHMAERAGFVALGTFLAFFPRTPFSFDAWMRGESLTGRD